MPDQPEPFPRGIGLPNQSPLFWVSQKDRYLRQLLIKDIQASTGRDLLVYFTDCGSTAQIDANDEPYLAELLGRVTSDEFDLLLETNGGLTDFAENVVSTLRNWGKKFRVIVPSRAKSNGTVIALAAQTIVMGANSELGPIDPSINGVPCTFVVTMAQHGQPVDPLFQLAAAHAIEQTKQLARNVLRAGMMSGVDDAAFEAAIMALSTRDVYHSHGSVIDHREAKRLGLNVTYLPPSDDLWQRFWLLRCMYAHDIRRAGHAKIFESAAVGQSLLYPAPPAPAS